jgi:predicted ATPase
MIHLQAAQFSAPTEAQTGFPFSVPVIAGLAGQRLRFDQPVTIIIGDNGSGKSTLLEALACAIGSITVGSAPVERDASLQAMRRLAYTMRLVWTRKTKRGFFLRSEDFFGYAKHMAHERAEMEAVVKALDEDVTLTTTQRALAKMPYMREIAAMARRYGASLDSYSHGESFFTLFRARFAPNGLYLLDEPEAPLSPLRQLALISMIKELVNAQGAQFIIATHSPILMAYPGATIYTCDDGAVKPVSYNEIESVALMRDFLQNPDLFLAHL